MLPQLIESGAMWARHWLIIWRTQVWAWVAAVCWLFVALSRASRIYWRSTHMLGPTQPATCYQFDSGQLLTMIVACMSIVSLLPSITPRLCVECKGATMWRGHPPPVGNCQWGTNLMHTYMTWWHDTDHAVVTQYLVKFHRRPGKCCSNMQFLHILNSFFCHYAKLK